MYTAYNMFVFNQNYARDNTPNVTIKGEQLRIDCTQNVWVNGNTNLAIKIILRVADNGHKKGSI